MALLAARSPPTSVSVREIMDEITLGLFPTFDGEAALFLPFQTYTDPPRSSGDFMFPFQKSSPDVFVRPHELLGQSITDFD